MIMVVKPNTLVNNAYITFRSGSDAGSGSRFFSPRVRKFSGAYEWVVQDGTTTLRFGASVAAGARTLIAASYAAGATVAGAKLFVDGEEKPLTSGGSSNTLIIGATQLLIGASAAGFSWDGTVEELIYLEGASAAALANIQKSEGYLAHKRGLTASLPAAHPYKSSAP